MIWYVLVAIIIVLAIYSFMLWRNGTTSDVKQVWKHISTWALAFSGAIPGVYLMYYPQLRENLPAEWMASITAVVALIGILGKTVSQTKGT